MPPSKDTPAVRCFFPSLEREPISPTVEAWPTLTQEQRVGWMAFWTGWYECARYLRPYQHSPGGN